MAVSPSRSNGQTDDVKREALHITSELEHGKRSDGFGNVLHILGGGDGIILAVRQDGALIFFEYNGQGERDPTGNLGFAPNSGNQIGNGFQDVRHLFVFPREGRVPPRPRTKIFAVRQDGALIYFEYSGDGEQDPTGNRGFAANSGNQIGNGFQDVRHIVGIGGDRFLAVRQDGALIFFEYNGQGERDPTGNLGFAPNSGNQIGNGFQDVRHLFVFPREGRVPPRPRTKIFAVRQDGALIYFEYSGDGEQDPTGNRGFAANSGNQIGNGFQDVRHIVGIGGDRFLAVRQDGALIFFEYNGQGERDPTGNLGFAPNSGNQIGNGFQDVRRLFGGATDEGGFGHLIFAVRQDGALIYFRYNGNGEQDPTGNRGFAANSGNQIGNGF